MKEAQEKSFLAKKIVPFEKKREKKRERNILVHSFLEKKCFEVHFSKEKKNRKCTSYKKKIKVLQKCKQ